MRVSHHPDSNGRAALRTGVGLYVVFACIFAVGTPPLSGPDEGAHAVYIRLLATELRFPEMGPPAAYSETATATHQVQHPPGYYLLCAPLYRLLYSLNVSPWLALRMLSVLIGAGALVVIWRIGQRLFPEASVAAALSASAGMIPMFQYMTAMINNIGLAILFLALAAHRLAVILSGRDDRRQWALLGLVLGLASLTNLMGLAMCLIALTFLATRSRALGARETLLRAAVIVGGPTILAGWWFAHNYVVYGSLTPMFEGEPAAPISLLLLLVTQPLAVLSSAGIVLNNGVVQMWSLTWLMRETGSPLPVTVLIYLIPYIGVGLFVAGLVRARRAGDPRLRHWALLSVLTLLLVYGGVLRQVWYVDAQVSEFAGRYFVALLPFVLPVAAWGLEAAKPRWVTPAAWLAGLLGFLVVANAAHAAYVLWFFHRA